MVQILVSLYFNTKYEDMKKLIDYNPFEDLTNKDVQYWLGWLASDGCVVGNRISLSVQRKDRDILEKLNNFLNNKLNIYDGVYHKYKDFEYSKLSFRDTETAKFLNTLGITQNKTKNLEIKFPLTWSFVRGFFEGDGCLYIHQKRPRIQFTCASSNFVNQLRNFFDANNIKLSVTKVIRGKSIHYQMSISYLEGVYRFLDNIYSTANIFLNRKYCNARAIRNNSWKAVKLGELAVRIPS
jgi:hypothetical protein